jgi:hypothetical protein
MPEQDCLSTPPTSDHQVVTAPTPGLCARIIEVGKAIRILMSSLAQILIAPRITSRRLTRGSRSGAGLELERATV